MTIEQNVDRVLCCAIDIDNAISARGGTTQGGLMNAASAISSIPAEEQYPDLEQILHYADSYDYKQKVVFLIDANSCPCANRSVIDSDQYNPTAFIFSDNPTVLVTNVRTDYFFDSSKAIDGKWFWMIAMNNNNTCIGIHNSASTSYTQFKRMAYRIYVPSGTSFYCRGITQANYNLMSIEGDGTLLFPDSTSTTELPFYNSYSLAKIGEGLAAKTIGYDHLRRLVAMFQGCYNLRKVPNFLITGDTLDLSRLEGISYFSQTAWMSHCIFIADIPKKLILPVAQQNYTYYSPSNQTNLDWLATFDENGNIVDGICYGDNLNANTSQFVVTLNMLGTTNVNVITHNGLYPERWTAIKNALIAKGYAVSPSN